MLLKIWAPTCCKLQNLESGNISLFNIDLQLMGSEIPDKSQQSVSRPSQEREVIGEWRGRTWYVGELLGPVKLQDASDGRKITTAFMAIKEMKPGRIKLIFPDEFAESAARCSPGQQLTVVGDQLVTEYKFKSGRFKSKVEFTVVAMHLIQA